MTRCVYTHMIYSIRYTTLRVHLYGVWYMVKQAPCYISMCVCTHAYMYLCMHMYMYACMYVCMYVCIHVCMFVCMFALCMYPRTKAGGKRMMRHDRSRGGSISVASSTVTPRSRGLQPLPLVPALISFLSTYITRTYVYLLPSCLVPNVFGRRRR